MAFDAHSITSDTLFQRGQTGAAISPDGLAGRIVNMELTESGTLRAVRGPMEYHPATWENNGGNVPAATTYSTPHQGLFHCRTYGGVRDILLAHFGGYIWVHKPYEAAWSRLIGEDSAATVETPLVEDDGRPAFLTQFEATPNGVVIVPQGGRAHFYDGEYVAPLGFEEIPGPPTPMGPQPRQLYDDNAEDLFDVGNLGGYAHNTRQWAPKGTEGQITHRKWLTGAPAAIGPYRLGSLDQTTVSATGKEKLNNPLGGVLLNGEWRAAAQYIDPWGNLSAIGTLSAPVYFTREDNLVKERKKDSPEFADRMRMQMGWADIPLGPDHCVARNLLRTKDQLHTDLPGLFWVPPNATAGGTTFATLEDRAVTFYPDNIPDSWLLARATEVGPMPRFKVCCLAFGRMWYGNMLGNPGLVQHSYPGKWGTVQAGSDLYPDPTAAEVTGMHMASSGMLLFTETSTHLVVPNDQGDGFRATTLSTNSGCVSPDSIKTMPNGLTVWLGREGFFGFDGSKVRPLSMPIKDDIIRRINKVWRLRACAAVDPRMGEYRCAIPVDGATSNNLVVVFDGTGWRERNDTDIQAMCTTRDERQYMLALGTVTTDESGEHDSVWLLDHEAQGTVTPTTRECLVETSWLRSSASRRRGSPKQLDLWLKETTSGAVTVEVMRDWREHPTTGGSGAGPELHPPADPPPFWDTAVLDSTFVHKPSGDTINTYIVKRRPYWNNTALSVPSAQAFKVRIKYTGDMEFIGLGYEFKDRHYGGAQSPEGS